ncbi:hypothetical protein [Dyadobacter arcticus]|uniref:Protein SCO1/2 n=1 Tax=Dyadobacter arcticus TaxID=1078754 RepID=A0ABX0UIJ6_9BACT|nr:hypothetical protein [Dyadobacter arcticus]NIJ51036.1 protein SCO1/2 [Dyadobacter arcticus]
MKNFSKAGLLIITLVIPALIFIFLKFFARNHYDLPYYFPKRDGQGKVVFKNKDTVFYTFDNICRPLQAPVITNKLTVVSSLPEKCDDNCRLVIAQLQRINTLGNEITELNLLTLSEFGKPKDNSFPEEIGKGRWQLVNIARNEIDSCFRIDLAFQASVEGMVIPIEERLILIDREGYIRGYYNGTKVAETDRLMAEIKILKYENEESANQ